MACSTVACSKVAGSKVACSEVACSKVAFSEVACSKVACSTVACNKVACSTVACSTVACSTVACSKVACSTVACTYGCTHIVAHGCVHIRLLAHTAACTYCCTRLHALTRHTLAAHCSLHAGIVTLLALLTPFMLSLLHAGRFNCCYRSVRVRLVVAHRIFASLTAAQHDHSVLTASRPFEHQQRQLSTRRRRLALQEVGRSQPPS